MRNESRATAVEKSHEGDSKETVMRNYLHRSSTNGTSDAQEKELRKKAGGTVSGLSRDYPKFTHLGTKYLVLSHL